MDLFLSNHAGKARITDDNGSVSQNRSDTMPETSERQNVSNVQSLNTKISVFKYVKTKDLKSVKKVPTHVRQNISIQNVQTVKFKARRAK